MQANSIVTYSKIIIVTHTHTCTHTRTLKLKFRLAPCMHAHKILSREVLAT